MKSKSILIVEDDLIAAEYLKELLEEKDFLVCGVVDNANDAIPMVREKKPTLIMMDIMIKGRISGCELAMMIRSFDTEVLIIFLTAYSEEEMISNALDAKAYSYLLKPYRDIEIITTVQMALKTSFQKNKVSPDMLFSKNSFTYCLTTSVLSHNDEKIFLSEKLLSLVEVLMLNRGKSVSYEHIAFAIWKNDDSFNLNSLRAIVHRLKTQIPELDIHTISKIGYVLY